MQHGGKVILQGLPDRAHLQRVRKLVAVDAVGTVKGGHLFCGRGQSDRPIRACGQFEFDDVTGHRIGSNLNFGDAAWMGENEFNAARSANAEIPRLGMQRLPVSYRPGLLCVRQKRFTHMGEYDFRTAGWWGTCPHRDPPNSPGGVTAPAGQGPDLGSSPACGGQTCGKPSAARSVSCGLIGCGAREAPQSRARNRPRKKTTGRPTRTVGRPPRQARATGPG